MADTHKFLVVDEYDNVVGYFATYEDADARAARECATWSRSTHVYAITEVGQHTYTEEAK